MIDQQAAALLVGDAKQRSALYAFLRDKLLVDPGCVVGGDVRVAACSTRGRRRAVRLECGREVSQWRRRFEVGALDADVGSRAQQLQALLARVQNTTAVHIKDLSLGKLEHAATPGTALGVRGLARASALCVAAAVRRERCMLRGARVALLPAAACCARHAGQRRRRTRRREQRLASCCVSDAAGDAVARGLSIANVRASADCRQLSN
jgi:hypothetical protein